MFHYLRAPLNLVSAVAVAGVGYRLPKLFALGGKHLAFAGLFLQA